MAHYGIIIQDELKELEKNLDLLLEHRKIKDAVNEFEDLEHYVENIKQRCKEIRLYAKQSYGY